MKGIKAAKMQYGTATKQHCKTTTDRPIFITSVEPYTSLTKRTKVLTHDLVKPGGYGNNNPEMSCIMKQGDNQLSRKDANASRLVS